MRTLPPFTKIQAEIAQHPVAIILKRNIKRLCPKSHRFLVALSGGPDSTALLVMAWSLGIEVEAAHFNYKLRGEYSDADETFCIGLCHVLEVRLHKESLDTKSTMKESGKSLQTYARDVRYAFFETICKKRNIDTILTAHHLDDSIESFFINLLRGTGLNGLTGIPGRRDNIARPLISVQKAEIMEFLTQFSIPFRKDQTNEESTYVRNQIRNQLIPAIEEIQPSYRTVLQSDMDRLNSAVQFISNEVDKWKDQNMQTVGEKYTLLRSAFGLEVADAFIYEIFKPFRIQWSEVNKLKTALKGQPGKIFTTSSHTILIDREHIIVSPNHDSTAFQTISLEQADLESDNVFDLPSGRLTIQKHHNDGQPQKVTDSIVLDTSMIKFPLVIRRWLPGDRFQPIGMAGKHQKISDFLTNRKVDRLEKANVIVLADEEMVYWVIGYRKDQRLKRIEKTKGAFIRFTYKSP